MPDYYNVLLELTNFLIVGVIFLVMLAISFTILLKKFKVDRNRIKFYGLFLEMDNKSIISFATISLNYLFLTWCITTFQMNIYYIVFSSILMLIGDLLILNYPKGLLNLLNNLVICLIILAISLLYNYLVFETFNVLVVILLILLILFVFVYLTFIMFKTLNGVVIKHKFLRRKKYEKSL